MKYPGWINLCTNPSKNKSFLMLTSSRQGSKVRHSDFERTSMAVLLHGRRNTANGGLPMKRGSSTLLRLVLFVALTILPAGPVLAQDQDVLGPVRCGTRLVQVGDTKEQILAKCGQPTRIDPGTRGGVEIWYYDGSSGTFSGFLRFTGPNLTSIERSD